MNKEFSTVLKKARSTKGLSQAQVSDDLYISRSAYHHFEAGIRTPSVDTLIRISAYFSINPIDLLTPLIPSEIKESNPEFIDFINFHKKQRNTNHLNEKFERLNKPEQQTVLNLIDTILEAHHEIN